MTDTLTDARRQHQHADRVYAAWMIAAMVAMTTLIITLIFAEATLATIAFIATIAIAVPLWRASTRQHRYAVEYLDVLARGMFR